MTGADALTRDYRVAFLSYLPQRGEAGLHRGYELGRAAVDGGVSILDLARVHHEVLLEALRETPPEEVAEVATAASEFFLEVLATFDMTQRSFLPGRGAGSDPTPDAPDPRPASGIRAHRPRAG
ncbi:phosphatase RsbU N-terminal domain-containing protein [Trujillonella endophytica]|uniref:Phosphoserine phosphatase RsbU, N-terminal domain n=1 Tax=Trujillonella endophytica TaxID=673521 RepID=A0A1H8W825_9ACTN|nr:phosphatase RsbU N-terminal domain-containing protein [Trujillella endophytica]SEP23791.1 Phosphoserine phosphatase RsbU, N-terminal domain [Trujillella endophytica]